MPKSVLCAIAMGFLMEGNHRFVLKYAFQYAGTMVLYINA